MNIMIAIPCYNCEPQISRVLSELDKVLDECPWIKKVAIVDNRSSDSTVKAALGFLPNLKNRSLFAVYRNKVNAGLGGTHKIAFSMGAKENFSHVMILHGDHQASPSDIPGLLKFAVNNSEATTLGSRFQNLRFLSGFSKIRIAGNLALNVFYTLGSGKKVSDLGSGLNLFKLSDIPQAEIQNFDNGFTFNMDLLLYLIRKKRNFVYTAIHWSTTDQISNVNALKVGWKTAKKLLLWILKIYPNEAAHFETEKLT